MAHSTVNMIGRLKDQRIDTKERLQLAQKLWQATDDDNVGPNRHQIVLDAILTMLIGNKKRHALDEKMEKEVWQTLSSLLHNLPLTSTSSQQPHLNLRPYTAQMMVETLDRLREGKGRKQMKDMEVSVLDCCHCMLNCPSLATDLTSRVDILLSLCSVLCQMAISQPAAHTPLPDIISCLATHLWQHHHRSQLPPSQMLPMVTDKLLEVVVRLQHRLVTMTTVTMTTVSPMTAIADSLQDFVLSTIFHQSHHKAFKTYLDMVLKQAEDGQGPWTISKIFTKLKTGLQHREGQTQDGDVLHRKEVLHFLPKLFRHAVSVWRQNNQQTFQLFIHLTTYLGLPGMEQEQTTVVALETDCLVVVRQLLEVVRQFGVYNVAADRAGDGKQLGFLKRLSDILLNSPVCEELCRCVVELLSLNHLILEPSLPALLSHTCSGVPQMSEQYRMTLDTLLSELVSTYSLLHQVPRCYNFFLQLTSKFPHKLMDTLSLPRFSQQVSQVVRMLPHSTAVELWGKLQTEINTVCSSVLNDQHKVKDTEQLWACSLLFHQYLQHLGVYDWRGSATVADRVVTLTLQLENDLLQPLFQHVHNNRRKNAQSKLCQSMLLLAVCLGHIKLMLAAYRTSHMTLPPASSNQMPFTIQLSQCVHSTSKSAVDPVVRFLGDVLTSQRLQLIQQEKQNTDWSKLMADITVWDDEHTFCHWDGHVCSINRDTYCIAKSHLLVYTCGTLLPLLVKYHSDRLASSVVRVLARPSTTCTGSSDGHTCTSVARHLLQQTTSLHAAGTHSAGFVHRVLCSIWQQFLDCAAPTEPASPFLTVLKQLANPQLAWGDVSNREVKMVASSVQELITSGDVETFPLTEAHTAVLKVLEELPLTCLPPGSRLQCIVGLLLVLAHQDRKGWSGCDVRDWLCRQLTGLLEASVGTSLFLCLSGHTVLCCLQNIVVQCEAGEDTTLGQLLKKAVVMVMGDFHSVLHLDLTVTDMEKRWQRMCKKLRKKKRREVECSQTEDTVLMILTHTLLCQTPRYLKKEFYRQDVQSASRQHFDRLSLAVEEAVDIYRHQQSQGCLPSVLIRCFTAVISQRCSDAEQGQQPLSDNQLERIKFVLNTLSLYNGAKKDKESLEEELSFVSCLYRHHRNVHSLLTTDATRQLWTSLLTCLHHQHTTTTTTTNTTTMNNNNNDISNSHNTPVKTPVKRHQEDNKVSPSSAKRRKTKNEHSQSSVVMTSPAAVSQPHSEISGGGGINDGGGIRGGGGINSSSGGRGNESDDNDEEVLKTMVVMLASCPVSVFEELLQHLITSMVSDVRQTMRVWQRVVSCDALTVEQRRLLESLCITVLQQCVQVMQHVHSSPQGGAVTMGLPVLQCLTAMLTQHKLLSTKGTVLCLLCVSLLPLGPGSYREFLVLLPAVCDAVHAVLVHHPHTALQTLDLCMAIASSALKECIRHGDQKLLLANPDNIQPLTACADHVSRLLTLLVSDEREVQRVVASLVSDYTTAVQSLTLLPAVKKALLPGMYACLDTCDKHAVNQLRQRLPAGVREVFHMLHQDFTNHHKYTGKV